MEVTIIGKTDEFGMTLRRGSDEEKKTKMESGNRKLHNKTSKES